MCRLKNLAHPFCLFYFSRVKFFAKNARGEISKNQSDPAKITPPVIGETKEKNMYVRVMKTRIEDATQAFERMADIKTKLFSDPIDPLTYEEIVRLREELTMIQVVIMNLNWDAHMCQPQPRKFKFWKR